MISVYAYNTAANFVNQKSDVANLVGSLIFAGLLLSLVLILKSDVTKLVKNLKEEKSNEWISFSIVNLQDWDGQSIQWWL